MEVSFSKEIESLRLGAGDTFHGEGILAVTKALLESGGGHGFNLRAHTLPGAFEDFVASETAAGPVCLVLEDLQWGDASGGGATGSGDEPSGTTGGGKRQTPSPTRGGMDDHGAMGTDKIRFGQ